MELIDLVNSVTTSQTTLLRWTLSKASGPDCILVVVLENCEPQVSYILAELFNNCLKKSCFPDCWKVPWSLYLRMLGTVCSQKHCPVSLLSVVSKVFEKLVNNRVVDHLEKCGLFSNFQYGFRSSRSTANLFTVYLIELLGLLTGLGLLEL